MRCDAPTRVLHRLRLATRSPGRVLNNNQQFVILLRPRLNIRRTEGKKASDLHAAVKVHAVDSNRRIVFDSQIDMFADAEPEVPCFREILLFQFVLLDF